MSESGVLPTDPSEPTIILSCAAGNDESRRRYEESLLNMLQLCAHRRILVVPHLYYLRSDHPAVKRLGEIRAPVILLSWLFPRAARWTLAALLGRPVEHLAALNLSRFASSASCAALAEAILMGDDEAECRTPERVEYWLSDGIRESSNELGEGSELPPRWYPVIDRERCVNCRQCMDFCLFSVYSTDEDGRVVVSHSDGCKMGCPACSRICPMGAIIFPHYDAEPLIAGAVAGKGGIAAGGDGGDVKSAGAGGGEERPAQAHHDDLDELMDQLDELDRDST